MGTPPKGVDDVFAAVVVLLAGVHKGVICDKRGKVKEKDKGWDAAKKALLSDVKSFLDMLLSFKDQVDEMKVPEGNWADVRPYLELPHFNPEAIRSKNSAAAGLVSWVVNIVIYRDIVVTVEPKKAKLKEAKEELDSANAKLGESRRWWGWGGHAEAMAAADAGAAWYALTRRPLCASLHRRAAMQRSSKSRSRSCRRSWTS